MTHRTDAQDDSLTNANTQTRVEVSALICRFPAHKQIRSFGMLTHAFFFLLRKAVKPLARTVVHTTY